MELYASLLNERPNDVNFELFERNEMSQFLAKYFTRFGELPPKEVFESEFQLTLPTSYAPWPFYETKLKEEFFVRQALPALVNFNENYEKDQKQALLKLREQLVSLADPDGSPEPVSIVHDLSRHERFKEKDNERIPTGIEPLDEAMGGFSIKDEFVIISARMGIGKSWIAQAMASHMTRSGYRVGFYSGEMSEDQVGARFDSLISNLSNYALTRGINVDLTEHYEKLSHIEGDLLVITPKQLRRNARPSDMRKFALKYDLDVLFLDQLSLMEPDGMRGGADYERKALLSYQLKSLQQELRIPIIAVSQLNRGAQGETPNTSHIAGSDRIGQDATLVLALGRKDDTLKMKVLKARDFRIPEQPWEFTWDIDKGILAQKLSGLDAVRANVQRAEARQRTADAIASQEGAETARVEVEDDEIW